MAVGIRHYTDRTGDGFGQPAIDADGGEEVLHVQGGVTLVLANRRPESTGTLFITSQRVIWLSDEDRSKGYAVDFLSISLHAVSRDPDAYPSPCIYAQIETETEDDEADGNQSDDSESGSDDGPPDLSQIKEMRLVPSDPDQLNRLFEVFCECAELNPEPIEEEQEEEEEEEEHDWIFSADQLPAEGIDVDGSAWNFSEKPNGIGYSNGDYDLSHNVLQLQIDDQCFEDAEEMKQDNPNGARR